MIYLITGVPGSGKSLYAVSTLLRKLMKEKVRHEDGSVYDRRLVIDNIPDLLLPHEPMVPRVRPVTAEEVVKNPPNPEGCGLWNWFDWCKPGDIIVSDEVQRHWRPRGLGSKVPREIAELETHRHKGVDLVLITQNAMLLDQNVRRLVGRHLHVRRIFGGARALIYDWDGCQADTNKTRGSTSSMFNYPKSAYKLYKSSELHTKQHHKIPLWFAFPLVVAGLAIFAGPKAYSALHRTMSGQALTADGGKVHKPAAKPGAGQGTAVAATPAASSVTTTTVSTSGPAAADSHEKEEADIAGCIVVAGHCGCLDSDGDKVDVEPAACMERIPKAPPMDLTKFIAKDDLEAPVDLDRQRAAVELAVFARERHGPTGLTVPNEASGLKLLGTTVVR